MKGCMNKRSVSFYIAIGFALLVGGCGGGSGSNPPTLADNGNPHPPSITPTDLPTTSTDQYAATLASWFSVSATERQYVLPNLGHFSSGNLGFIA